MNKIIAIIVAIVILAGGAFFFMSRSTSSTAVTPVTSAPSETTNPNAGGAKTTPGASGTGTTGSASSGTFTLADVAKHADRTSCYSAINGNVYDLTSWIDQHPGGAQRILSICGRDGSSAFNAQHGTDPRVNSILAGFKIGTLI